MRLNLSIAVVLAVFFLILNTGCPGEGGTSSSSGTPPDNTAASDDNTTNNNDDDNVIQEDDPDEIFGGQDVEEMLDEWEALGEDTEDILFYVTDEDGDYIEIQDYVITDLSIEEFYQIEYELPKGHWESFAWGGKGCIDLDMYAYGDGGDDDILDRDELEDNYPMVIFDLDGRTTVTFEIEPYEISEKTERVNILWFLYSY